MKSNDHEVTEFMNSVQRALGVITITQRKWLTYLCQHGESKWEDMPKNARGHVIGRNTFSRMETLGLIETEFRMPHRYFRITEAGQSALTQEPKP